MKKLPSADIALLLRLSKSSGRDILHGFSTAVRKMRRTWRLHVFNYDMMRAGEDLDRLREIEADALVVHGTSAETDAILASYPVPFVFIGPPSDAILAHTGPAAFVGGDDVAIGTAGAHYLETLGPMRAWGFVGANNNLERAEAFRAALAGRYGDVRIYGPDITVETDVGRLAEWLRALPHPAAVMAAQDAMAFTVLDAAARAGLRVPRDLAVLGVDNDELICETADPPLTSVAVDYARLGALAANAVKRLMAAPDIRPARCMAPIRSVVERQSTRPMTSGAAFAERAAAFIRRNATKGIGASDVAEHLGASRSLVDLRFRQTFGESPHAMILRLRLEAVKERLLTTGHPVARIATDCGFRDANRAMHLFKERFGVAMSQWRRARWSDSPPERRPNGMSSRETAFSHFKDHPMQST